MKCERCNGTRLVSVACGSGENIRLEACSACGGVGSLPDFVFEGKASIEDNGELYLFNFPDKKETRTSISYLVRQRFLQIKDRPIKLRITIQKID